MQALRLQLSVFLATLILPGSPLWAKDPSGNALMLLDAYLAQAALGTIEYRTDLKKGGDPGSIPPGRLSGFTPLIGTFTYRPKTYDELTKAERIALLHDPKFHSFLIATREQLDRKPLSISPEEMLLRGPLSITLPQP